VIELNRAVALAMRDGAEAGLVLVDGILDRGDLAGYYLAHAARAALILFPRVAMSSRPGFLGPC
jgi:RNA polymerase sigma-70 factor, ECF subfamily